MKKTISTLMLLLVAISTVFADANYNTRKNCWGFISWRHKAYASVTRKVSDPHYNADGSETKTSCQPIYLYKYGMWFPFLPPKAGSSSYHDAIAKGENGRAYSWVRPEYTPKFAAGGNTDMQIADLSYSPMYESGNSTTSDLEGSFADISTTSIDFDEVNHRVILNGINARLGVDDPDMANAYATFKIWILNATGVSDENDAVVIDSMQAFILNGQLIIRGGLQQSNFTQEGQKAIFNFTGLTKNFNIPSSISLDDIIVKVGSDVGNLGQGVNEDYRINFNTNQFAKKVSEIVENSMFKLDIIGNPATNNLNFVVAKGTKTFTNVNISIVANDGKVVNQIYNGEVGNSDKNFSIDISALATGNYYLTVVTNTNEKFVRKFIKQ